MNSIMILLTGTILINFTLWVGSVGSGDKRSVLISGQRYKDLEERNLTFIKDEKLGKIMIKRIGGEL